MIRNPVTKITPTMEKGLEYMLANPHFKIADIARVCEVHYQTAYKWVKSPVYYEEYKRRVNTQWREAVQTAQLQLINRVRNDDWKAIEYILDSAGYNATQKVELKNDTITINITGDSENE